MMLRLGFGRDDAASAIESAVRKTLGEGGTERATSRCQAGRISAQRKWATRWLRRSC